MAVGRLRERPTIDVVAIALTALILIIGTVAVIGVVIVEIVDPSIDTSRITTMLDNHAETIIVALVALFVGRPTGGRPSP
jgi:hypothetical protein